MNVAIRIVAAATLLGAAFAAGRGLPCQHDGGARHAVDPWALRRGEVYSDPDPPVLADCVGHKCLGEQDLEPEWGGVPPMFLGADLTVVPGEASSVGVAWRVDSTTRFEAWMSLVDGDLFPLREGLAKMVFCRDMRHFPDGTKPRTAVIRLEPDVTVDGLAPNDVFIPLNDGATLNGEVHATAHFRGNDSGANAVEILIASRLEHHEYPELHEGEGFRWGPYQATIKRIVNARAPRPGNGYAGWVEVA